jgi:hypothetical protein
MPKQINPKSNQQFGFVALFDPGKFRNIHAWHHSLCGRFTFLFISGSRREEVWKKLFRREGQQIKNYCRHKHDCFHMIINLLYGDISVSLICDF